MNNKNVEDYRWMERALDLAEQAIGLTSPNPSVGCVLVKDSQLIGEGFHNYELKDHAEIAALKNATESPRGATAYVTLEPCSHTGRTGPCSMALIEAGVQRVVAATADPNPLVRGQGFEQLRAAGIDVAIGIGQIPARRINESFARWIQAGKPFVTLKTATSLDGRIAPPASQRSECEPWWITGAEARGEVQRMRHAHDAILTGINTILADDPQLTDRSGLPRRTPLKRIVLDSNLRIPLTSQLLQDPTNPVLIFTTSTDEAQIHKLQDLKAEVITLESSGGRVSLKEVFAHLGDKQILSVMAETGSKLNTALLTEGYVDRLRMFIAPLFLGNDALPAFEGLTEPLRIPAGEATRFGDDLAWDMLLRDPWKETLD